MYLISVLEVTPAQHCPSLLVLGLTGKASSFLFQSLAIPNINAQTIILWCMTSSNLSALCAVLCQTTSLRSLDLVDTDLTTHEAKELLFAAVMRGRRLVTPQVKISLSMLLGAVRSDPSSFIRDKLT